MYAYPPQRNICICALGDIYTHLAMLFKKLEITQKSVNSRIYEKIVLYKYKVVKMDEWIIYINME